MSWCKYCEAPIDWIQPREGRPVSVEPWPVVAMPDRGTEEFITDEGEWIKEKRTLAGPVGGNMVVYEPHRKYCNSKR